MERAGNMSHCENCAAALARVAVLESTIDKVLMCVQDHAEGGNIENYSYLLDKFDEVAQ